VRLSFDELGMVGFIADLLPHELPPEAWSAGKNVRMRDGYAMKMAGHTPVYGTPAVAPYWLLPVPTTVDYMWLYASLAKVHVVDSSRTHTDITRTVGGDYAATLNGGWNGGVLNGIPIINNGVDVPQMWKPATVATPLAALTAWDAAWRTKAIRPFKSFLFALDVTESGVRYPHKVRWSHPALPGDVPASWDEADTTKDAGQVTLGDSGGYLLDCLPLRNTNIVYKEDQIWGLQYVGGNQIFREYKILGEAGALTRDCAAAFFNNGLKHAVFGSDDLYVHDGNSAVSIATKMVKRWLFNQIAGDVYQRAFVVPNYDAREIWFCFPVSGDSLATLALPWSWETGTFGTPRELPSVRFLAAGLINDTGVDQTWDGDSGVWDSDSGLWDDRLYGSAARRVLMGVPGDPSLQYVDTTNQFAGTNMSCFLERTGLAFIKKARDGALKADVSVRKLVQEIWPRIEAPNGTQVDVYVGAQEEVNGGVTWSGPFPFIVGTTQKISPLVAGRFIAVKFLTAANVTWKLHSYEMEIVPVGKYA
jgi:hypothetical protein